ncbi:ABC transporter ATP-binding protein [Paramaledivibacter caminithermalis]|uniref:Peptide/nickel transport system ATP-binding protein n=1 Tax=Paramaledivibacter caminithermalis (strain DSM 15212 / CIP 107654 / DViRD3) TaxID=1121301 RepID=A0A1M6RH33_PARC5|nr:ABC transporter ATP-binding protein [Paramaledivibacter caminithermalis]SHK31688.1 peptide/nickel transport system ATP-binding protein [Paramaledivibacter caminithermalis DSM 15212]
MCTHDYILSGKNITRVFGQGKNKVVAVDNVSFSFTRGEIISIVGESGSGKTTLAKILLGLLKQSDGDIFYCGKKLNLKERRSRREYWSEVQAVFQDPFSSFNMFYKVETLLRNCLKLRKNKLSKEEQVAAVKDACKSVNLEYEELYDKHPFELSGGQMQRLMIARTFLIRPRVLIADEPTSMIDACSRASILDMLLKLRDENNTTIIFITHDVGLAYYVSNTIYIMEKGRIIERGTADEIILNPKENYTQQLLKDVPKIYESWDLA